MILLEPPRTAWDLKWTMLHTPVRVHPVFWLVALLLCYDKGRQFGLVLTSIACLFFTILVHEFGHALCGRYYGDRDNRIVLHACYGLCLPGRGTRRWPLIAELLWGPGAGFILGALALGARWAVRSGYIAASNVYLESALDSLVWFSLIWGAVNLLPIYPLDGGQILRELIAWKAPRRGNSFVFRVSFITALAMAVAALALYLYDHDYGLFPMLFFIALAYSSWDLLRQLARYGDLGEDEDPRQPWEQDSDWWKK